MKTRKLFFLLWLVVFLGIAFSCEDYDEDMDSNYDDEYVTFLRNSGIPITVLHESDSPVSRDQVQMTHYRNRLDENEIKSISAQKLRECLGNLAKQCHRIVATVRNDDHCEYVVADCFSKYDYGVKAARIEFDESSSVVEVRCDYQEKDPEAVRTNYSNYGSCPDNSVDIVVSTCETGIRTAVQGVNDAEQFASQAGYKVRKLIGSQENISAVLNWLSCPNLLAYGRIGHGSPYGIKVSNGTVSSQHFDRMSNTALRNKVLFFNSCQVHNNPLKSSVVGAGTQKFMGGITTLGINASEKVFSCWHKRTLLRGNGITDALRWCEKNASPRYPGRYGISGNGPDDFPGTSINDGGGDSSGDCHTVHPGHSSYCTSSCPCDRGEGDCDNDSQCKTGLTCVQQSGTDFCELKDNNSGGDCHTVHPDHSNYCTRSCPCNRGEGDCDYDSQCKAGLACVQRSGTDYCRRLY